jgi:hypothetical protein
MRFSHTADCHIGGHRDPRLKALSEQAFTRFITESINERVEFIIIAGDLFNTAIPGIDTLKFTVTQLGRAKQHDIPVYAIPGSHDFSPSGKTMLDVLEEAQLLKNVCRGTITEQGTLHLTYTTDKKTGVKLTGVIGKRGMLDRQIYEALDHTISDEPGKKIFLFHTAITELKPKDLEQMEAAPVSFLPKGFDYYAGGHVHIVERYNDEARDYRNVVYPGPLFPNSFSEFEKLRHGGYFLYDDTLPPAQRAKHKPLPLKEVIPLHLDVSGKDATAANAQLQELAATLSAAHLHGAIVLLRVEGTLTGGSPNDLDLRTAIHSLEERGAYIVLRNTSRLESPEFAAIHVTHEHAHDLLTTLLDEHADQLQLDKELRNDDGKPMDGPALARDLLAVLSQEHQEGEKIGEHQDRVIRDALALVDRGRDAPDAAAKR